MTAKFSALPVFCSCSVTFGYVLIVHCF
uniref:Uncharacterized protein n=1 Tax=Anguilla anguilla TaxID=7936 RepID=A0A0E9PRQ8_ANGAN